MTTLFRTQMLTFIALSMLACCLPVNANIDQRLELSKELQDAVDNGVTLFFKCDFATLKRPLFFTFKTKHSSHSFRLTRHVLSKRYMVRTDTQTAPKMFRSATEALGFVHLESIRIMSNFRSEHPDLHMRLSLNKYRLPAPMRLQAFINNQWHLDTGWNTWPSAS